MRRLREKIIDFLYQHAMMRKGHHGLMTFLGGLFFSCAVLITILLALISDKLMGLPAWPLAPLNLIPALPLIAAGIWLWLWSVLTFIRSRGTPVPLSPPPKLVDTGPYAYSRNPMLAGVFLMLFGIGFLLRSPSLVILFTPLFMVISFCEFKMIEEPELEKRLGAPYVEYRQKVPMFFPYPSRGKHKNRQRFF